MVVSGQLSFFLIFYFIYIYIYFYFFYLFIYFFLVDVGVKSALFLCIHVSHF